jgi:hypothetical protein
VKEMNEDLFLTTYEYNFGVILPRKTGVFWEQQTEGCACHHIQVEGIYYTLVTSNAVKKVLADIQDANYRFKPKLLKTRWQKLKNLLKEQWQTFTFEEVEAPEGQPKNQEGIQWIKIIHWKFYNGMISRMVAGDNYYPFDGKVVALIYPNCD